MCYSSSIFFLLPNPTHFFKLRFFSLLILKFFVLTSNSFVFFFLNPFFVVWRDHIHVQWRWQFLIVLPHSLYGTCISLLLLTAGSKGKTTAAAAILLVAVRRWFPVGDGQGIFWKMIGTASIGCCCCWSLYEESVALNGGRGIQRGRAGAALGVAKGK